MPCWWLYWPSERPERAVSNEQRLRWRVAFVSRLDALLRAVGVEPPNTAGPSIERGARGPGELAMSVREIEAGSWGVSVTPISHRSDLCDGLESALPREIAVHGWRLSENLDANERALEDEDSAQGALDLAAGLLFGELALDLEFSRGRARRWKLMRSQGKRWNCLVSGTLMPRAWLCSRTIIRYRNRHRRGSAYGIEDVVAPSWAPWAGLGGFTRAEVGGHPGVLPIDGELDLHNFLPKEVKALLLAYIDECTVLEIVEIRIVHGKGKGNLRRTVHGILTKHPLVVAFRLGSGLREGGWGATLATLRTPSEGSKVETGCGQGERSS